MNLYVFDNAIPAKEKYTSSYKPPVKKNDKKKKATAPKAETPPQENAQEQMALF